MDLNPFKLDIDELLADYATDCYTTLGDFKRVWMENKFSFVYEGRPKTNSGVFMQSLFLHCIGRSYDFFSEPYKPQFKIYLSTVEECKQLKDFVVTAKQNGVRPVRVVPALVKRMLDKVVCEYSNREIYAHGLGEKFELDSIKKLSKDYAEANKLAIPETSQTVDVEDARHILQDDKLLSCQRMGLPEGRVVRENRVISRH
ncbi:hypothetical protein ACP4OV_023192 [Aristida adscensionis]